MYDNKKDKNSSININQNKNDLKTKIQSEINCYEEFEILVHEQLSPLEFYRINQNIFNKLSHMAKMVFSITSSVASGGTFSNVKKKISVDRNLLAPEHSEDCLFISQNKRFET